MDIMRFKEAIGMNMEKILNKIADIVDDMSIGAVVDDGSCRDFMRGYLMSCVDNGEISRREMTMVLKFYDRLMDGKMFIAK